RLGSTYLARMAARFDGNLIMMAAAYNAGPSRPSRWMDEFGDPRAGEIDIIDWIESIPFAETRNYVMRIAESVPIYRARLGLNPFPVPFSEELVGDTFAVQGE
ncbi:MAG: transglycosylase SLT domain-containing protein, partial [Pseudomonadota bacterium]